MHTPSPSYQRLSTPRQDYLLPTLAQLAADKAAGVKSVIRVCVPKIIEGETSHLHRALIGE